MIHRPRARRSARCGRARCGRAGTPHAAAKVSRTSWTIEQTPLISWRCVHAYSYTYIAAVRVRTVVPVGPSFRLGGIRPRQSRVGFSLCVLRTLIQVGQPLCARTRGRWWLVQRTIPSCGPALSRHTGAELAYYDTGVRTSVRRLAVWAATFLEFCLQGPPPPASPSATESGCRNRA